MLFNGSYSLAQKDKVSCQSPLLKHADTRGDNPIDPLKTNFPE